MIGGQFPPAVVGVRDAKFAVKAVNGAVERMQDAVDEIVLHPEIALQSRLRAVMSRSQAT